MGTLATPFVQFLTIYFISRIYMYVVYLFHMQKCSTLKKSYVNK